MIANTERAPLITRDSSPESQHLETDHLLANLEKRAVTSGFVTVAAQGIKFILNLTSSVVLARLLGPAEFGLVAMATAVTALLGLLINAGLSTATVQKERISHAQVSNLFWINVALSTVVTLAGIAIAPVVVWFYHEPRLFWIMVVLSSTFLLTGSTLQHQALLIRQMRFKAVGTIEVVSILCGFISGVTLAELEFGPWALVSVQVVVAATSLVMTWSVSRWRPGPPTRGSDLRSLVHFGAHLTTSNVIGRFAENSDAVLIGRMFGAHALGLYSRAAMLLHRPLEQVLTPAAAVLVPVLSRLQSEPDRYRRTFLRAYDTLALIVFPAAAVFMVVARPLILVLLGVEWLEAAPLFAGLSLAVFFLPLGSATTWLFTSQGRGRDFLRTVMLMSVLVVAAFVVGLRWGPLGLVISYSATGVFLRLPILYYQAGRSGPVTTADLWKGFFCFLPIWVAVFVGARTAHALVADNVAIVQLLVSGLGGLVTGAIAVFALERPRRTALTSWNTVKSLLETSRERV